MDLSSGFGKKKEIVLRSPEDVLEFILNGGIIEVPPYKSERRGDSLYIPKYGLYLTPSISQISEHDVGIEFNMYVEKFDKYLYEYAAGMGKNLNSAVGMAISSFLISFISTFELMHSKKEPRVITSEFAGNKHKWDVFLGSIVCMGETGNSGESESAAVYWSVLEDEIKKRLGNQKMVYVKVYAAKQVGSIIGEVRFDDVAIPELGEKVRKIAENWDVKQFRSEKQFFFIEQDASTTIPGQYDGAEGRKKMRNNVLEYLKLYEKATTRELYESLVNDSSNLIGDRVLANECFSLIPEMAALCALDGNIEFSDELQFGFPDGKTVKVYASQLSDYAMLDYCFTNIISDGDFGEETRGIWQDLVRSSVLYRALARAQANGVNEMPNLSKLVLNVDENFVLR